MEQIINNEVPNVVQQESFFDRHLVRFLSLLNIISFLTFFIIEGFANPYYLVLYDRYLVLVCLLFPMVTILLFVFNYHNKKTELLSVVKKLGVIIAISLLILISFYFMLSSFVGGMI